MNIRRSFKEAGDKELSQCLRRRQWCEGRALLYFDLCNEEVKLRLFLMALLFFLTLFKINIKIADVYRALTVSQTMLQ